MSFHCHFFKCKERDRQQVQDQVVFPCVLKIIEDEIFQNKNPIILGCLVEKCDVRVGTPLCVISEEVTQMKAF